jgi:predicted DNA-binding transcriptional regulator AlpA
MSDETIHPDFPEPDIFLTEKEVREILGLSRQSCYNMRRAGIFTSHYVKGKVKYSAAEVEAYIERKSLPDIRVTPTIRTRAKPGEPKKERVYTKPSRVEQRQLSDEGCNAPSITKMSKRTPPPLAMPEPSYEDFDNYFI